MERNLYLEMPWIDIKSSIESKKSLFFMVSSIKQHGPHRPVGTDTIPPIEIALKVAGKCDGVVDPSKKYGYKSILKPMMVRILSGQLVCVEQH